MAWLRQAVVVVVAELGVARVTPRALKLLLLLLLLLLLGQFLGRYSSSPRATNPAPRSSHIVLVFVFVFVFFACQYV